MLRNRRCYPDRVLLERLAMAENLWHRRVAVVSTLFGVRHGEVNEALHVATLLRNDGEDLIQKAVGWLLREVGQHDLVALTTFLEAHGATMPRTMLRYAIEHFSRDERTYYMGLKQDLARRQGM